MTDWVTVHNPSSGNTARVPRSALPQMPKWRPGEGRKAKAAAKAAAKTSDRSRPETDADTPSADHEE